MNDLSWKSGDMLVLDVPGCRITQRLRIDAAWENAMLNILSLAAALYRGRLSPVDIRRSIRDELDGAFTKLSSLERRIILDYATNRVEA